MNLSKNHIYRTLDWLWRLIVKAGKDRCEVCGGRDILECHHIVGRRNLWLRWDPDNGILTDRRCHERSDKILQWLRADNPKRYERLMHKKNCLHRGEKIDLAAIERKLRLEI